MSTSSNKQQKKGKDAMGNAGKRKEMVKDQSQPSAISATPATQNARTCRQVPRLPRRIDARCRQVPRLPRKQPQRPRRQLGPERATRASPVP